MGRAEVTLMWNLYAVSALGCVIRVDVQLILVTAERLYIKQGAEYRKFEIWTILEVCF